MPARARFTLTFLRFCFVRQFRSGPGVCPPIAIAFYPHFLFFFLFFAWRCCLFFMLLSRAHRTTAHTQVQHTTRLYLFFLPLLHSTIDLFLLAFYYTTNAQVNRHTHTHKYDESGSLFCIFPSLPPVDHPPPFSFPFPCFFLFIYRFYLFNIHAFLRSGRSRRVRMRMRLCALGAQFQDHLCVCACVCCGQIGVKSVQQLQLGRDALRWMQPRTERGERGQVNGFLFLFTIRSVAFARFSTISFSFYASLLVRARADLPVRFIGYDFSPMLFSFNLSLFFFFFVLVYAACCCFLCLRSLYVFTALYLS